MSNLVFFQQKTKLLIKSNVFAREIEKLFHKLFEGSAIHFRQVQAINVTHNILFRNVISSHLWLSSVVVVTAHFISKD